MFVITVCVWQWFSVLLPCPKERISWPSSRVQKLHQQASAAQLDCVQDMQKCILLDFWFIELQSQSKSFWLAAVRQAAITSKATTRLGFVAQSDARGNEGWQMFCRAETWTKPVSWSTWCQPLIVLLYKNAMLHVLILIANQSMPDDCSPIKFICFLIMVWVVSL